MRMILYSLIAFCLSFAACQPGASTSSSSVSASADTALPQPIPADTVDVDWLLGRFDPAGDSNFVRIQNEHSAGSGRGAYLQAEAYAAFVQMHDAAKAEGIRLIIKSATRNFYRQKEIWESKWNGERLVEGKNLPVDVPDPAERAVFILRFSSMPGTSRHHWGTDMDLNDFDNSYFERGQGLKEYNWLQTCAAEFGFCQPYTAKGEARPYGYEEEKWHWSYMPLASCLLAAYGRQVSTDSIRGFDGAEAAAGAHVIERYVMGVSEACK